MSLPNLTVRYGKKLSQSFDTDDLDAVSVEFVLVTDGIETVLKTSTLTLDPNDAALKIADLTLDGADTEIDTEDNTYMINLVYGDGDKVSLPEPGDDCIGGNCNLPKLTVCNIPVSES